MDQLYNTRSTNNKDKESKEKRWRRALIRALVHQNSIRAEGDYGSVSLLPDPVDAPARCKDGLKDDVIESLQAKKKVDQILRWKSQSGRALIAEFEKDTGEEEGLSITEFILECLLKLPLYLRKQDDFQVDCNEEFYEVEEAIPKTTVGQVKLKAESRPLHEPSLSGGPFHPDRQLLNNNRSEEELIVKSWCNRPIE
ncbi:hypothetical protein PPACK8108_LOCUS766 [Phakopsora pachyrhizi]|uniref:Uncharacterized protein n=1 Tax=Phakopsora pachyrhizi TaxID=170000 RepID=A0AAV0AI01_PHAPC|nr:hypothetical protein PPACK8108_LOCUS766 [Phakopsora pachyrhizi]